MDNGNQMLEATVSIHWLSRCCMVSRYIDTFMHKQHAKATQSLLYIENYLNNFSSVLVIIRVSESEVSEYFNGIFSYCHTVNQCWDFCVPLRHLSLSWASQWLAGGLSRSHGERLQNLKFQQTRAFAFPIYIRYPMMLQLGGLLPKSTPGH